MVAPFLDHADKLALELPLKYHNQFDIKTVTGFCLTAPNANLFSILAI